MSYYFPFCCFSKEKKKTYIRISASKDLNFRFLGINIRCRGSIFLVQVMIQC